MFKRFKPLRLSGWVLASSLLALAACGGKTSSAAGPPTVATPSNTPAVSQCDPAIMTNIVNDAYDRKSVNLNMGDTLLVMNETNDTFTLKTIPDDGLRYMVVDSKEMEHVPFKSRGPSRLPVRSIPARPSRWSSLRYRVSPAVKHPSPPSISGRVTPSRQ